MGVPMYRYNWEFFDNDSEEKYYILGFIAADGYVTNNEIEIGINIQDRYLLEQIRDLIVPDKPIYNKPSTNSVMLKLSSKLHAQKLKNYFKMSSNHKGTEIVFPRIPDNYVKDFIRGVVDGNGNIDTTKGYRGNKVYIGPRLRILGNHDFLVCLNERIKNFVNHETNAVNQKGNCNVYYVTYNFSTAMQILSWLYDSNNICLTRKYSKYLQVTGQDEDIV